MLQAILSIALMVGSGALLVWTLNTLSATVGAFNVATLILMAILIFTIGAAWMGRLAYHTPNYKQPHHGHSHHGINFALIIIVVGALLLAFNTGFLPAVWKGFFFSWPMALLVFGAIELFGERHFVSGIILVAVGKFFLIDKLSLIYPQDAIFVQFTSTYWPVLFIIVGILIFLQLLFKPKRPFFHHCGRGNYYRHKGRHYGGSHSTQDSVNGTINYSYVFSGTEHVFLEPEFRGGTIDTVLGGVNLDLRHTTLPEGETRLYIHALLGGVELVVPAGWHIEINPQAVLGGANDIRPNRDVTDSDRKLIIDAHCVLGGLVVR